MPLERAPGSPVCPSGTKKLSFKELSPNIEGLSSKSKNMLYSKKLSQFKNVTHGFTTRKEGDFRILREMPQSHAAVHLCGKEITLPEQVHGDKIVTMNKKNKGKAVKGADGLVTKEKGVVLGVTTADCLPILFFEDGKEIIGIIHAGWKGSLKRISEKMIRKIKNLGGSAGRLRVIIGPHIQKCCYDIDKRRGNKFRKEFGDQVIRRENGKLFLDLTKINLLQLLKSGVKKSNIEVLPFCTSCEEQLFSYRKDKENYGEMLSFIGIK